MATVYGGLVIADDTGSARRFQVDLKAGVKADAGMLLVQVAGLGVLPAAENAATGHCAGVVKEPADNTSGADRDVYAITQDGTRDFANDATHPCTAADEGATVYASDYQTVSRTSTDGPPVGKLVKFNPSNALPSRPCRVQLNVISL